MKTEHLFNTDERGFGNYLAQKPMFEIVRGEPKATETYTAAELKIMNIFGVYKIIDK